MHLETFIVAVLLIPRLISSSLATTQRIKNQSNRFNYLQHSPHHSSSSSPHRILDPDATFIPLPTDYDTPKNIDTSAILSTLPLSSRDVIPVLLPVTSNPGELCLLSASLVSEGEGSYIPAGRSYDGYDWERPAGRLSDALHFVCAAKMCQVNLPATSTGRAVEDNKGDYSTVYKYYLICHDQSTRSEEETVARFLERSTFGATPSLLSSWTTLTSSASEGVSSSVPPSSPRRYAHFLRSQIQNTPASSHREYFRRRLSPKSVESYKYGRTGPRPCEAGSRWRTYAFTSKDAYLSSGAEQRDTGSQVFRPNPRHLLTAEKVAAPGGGGEMGYVLKYAGEVRTVVYEAFKDAETGDVLDMSVGYYICYASEIEGARTSFRNDRFQIKANIDDVGCITVEGGNPSVNLDDRFVDTSSLHKLNLSDLSMENDINELSTGTGRKPGDYLLLKAVSDQTTCATLPDPYDNDFRSSFLTEMKEKYPMYTSPSRFSPDSPTFALLPSGNYAIHDYRLLLQENTIESPLADGGGRAVLETTYTSHAIEVTPVPAHQWWFREGVIRGEENAVMCANVVPHPVNEGQLEGCVLSTENDVACEAGYRGEDTDMFVTLDKDFLGQVRYHAPGLNPLVIVAVDGLVLEEGSLEDGLLPCHNKAKSRWVPLLDVSPQDCEALNSVQKSTVDTFATLLRNSVDNNPILRDVYYYEQEAHGIKCHADDLQKYGFRVKVTEIDGTEICFENVHPDLKSIYDITDLIQNHPNGPEIQAHSSSGILNYLSVPSFTMSSWSSSLPPVGPSNAPLRLGDTITANLAATYLVYNIKGYSYASRQSADIFLEHIAKTTAVVGLKGSASRVKNGRVLVCGSRGEVGPDEALSADSFDLHNGRLDSVRLETEQKVTVWANLALEAEDQLRQRLAWALSQMFNISPTTFHISNEGYLYLYDIHVRNAFGNYKDILREISFNPKAGEMLSFLGNKSIRYQNDISGEILHPDENYAREFMQLFTIGLHKLHRDGTERRDAFGGLMRTYETENILSFARAWTGFVQGPRRGNYEELDHTMLNFMEPMVIEASKHDFFPKMNLDGGYIGDGVPLCWDMPERAFLRKGAEFHLLGGSPLPRQTYDPAATTSVSSKRLILDSRHSTLYSKLCRAPDTSMACRFPGKVILDETLPCHGVECEVDTVVVIQVSPGVFYEYVRRPCVQLAFYEGAKKVTDKKNMGHMCAHPKMPVAVAACCGNTSPLNKFRGTPSCQYTGEYVSYATNEARCSAMGGHECDHSGLLLDKCDECCAGDYNAHWPENNVWYWTNEGCSFQMKVRIDGQAAIVHQPAVTTFKYGNPIHGPPETVSYVSPDDRNHNYITLHWPRDPYTNDALFPTRYNGCWQGECEERDDGTCLCDITVRTEVVFPSIPTREDVLTRLHVGAFEVDFYDDGSYRQVFDDGIVAVYAPAEEVEDYGTETVFRVVDEFGKTQYKKNAKSVVQIGAQGHWEMRNPPHFIDLAQFELRDIYHEIEAVIENIFQNPNTPPFVSKRLIQRFGISNPSPRYIRTVATAFSAGSYTDESHSGLTFGSGEYGSLEATVAALLLDRESTAVALDADPSYGSLREPLLKVVGFMRAMEYQRTEYDLNVYPKFYSLDTKIGQQPFNPPDQFSFFSPEYAPAGAITHAGLTSPESEILTLSHTVGIIQGFFSLVRNGLNDLGEGFSVNSFGANPNMKGQWADGIIMAGDYEKSVGYLSHTPPSDATAQDVADKAALLLTAGRMNAAGRAVLARAYNDVREELSEKDEATQRDYAWKVVQQVAATSPEFHTGMAVPRIGAATTHREPTPPQEPLEDDVGYKAIVVLFLFGGLDSYNLLVPDPSCGDLYASYVSQRGSVALKPQQTLPIDASSSEQPCDAFGVHSRAPVLKQIYDDGEGLFIANTGHLEKIVSKANWRQETSTDLFSHTSLEREAYSVDAFKDQYGTGILGRLLDVFQDKGYAVGSNAINEGSYALGGDPQKGRTTDVIPGEGIPRIRRKRFDINDADGMEDVAPYIWDLNAAESTTGSGGLFADHWSQNLVDTWNKTENLHDILQNHPTMIASGFWPGGLGTAFKTVAQMIKGHEERKKNRDIFFIRMGGFDAHADLQYNLVTNLNHINNALHFFRMEMKKQGNYDKVTTLMASEFGRTITPNSGGGTDHAWGGNYFMFGGGVKGGRIIGDYPETFWESDPTNIGRGRIIPTTPWDALWYGIAQWYGVQSDDDMKYVLPNHGNFGCFLFTDQDLFNGHNNVISGCDGVTIDFEITAFLNEPRYLTGEEQRSICEAAIDIATKKTGKTARCMIVDQKIIVNYARRLSDGTVDEIRMTLNEYLGAGGSRRLNGDPIFSISTSPLLTYSTTKVIDNSTGEVEPFSAVEMTQSLEEDLAPAMLKNVQNMTGLAEVVAETLAPTMSANPSLAPTVSKAPSLSPSISSMPSLTPSRTPSEHPSLSPSISLLPSQGPSYLERHTFEMMLYFENEENMVLDESEVSHFLRAIKNQLRQYIEITRENFIVVVSQEVVVERTELKLTLLFSIGSSNSVLGSSFENEIIQQLSLSRTEDKLLNFINDRGINAIGVSMLTLMSDSPSLSPSLSMIPSMSQVTTVPSLSPSISMLPSQMPSYIERYPFEMILYFQNEDILELQESEISVFLRATRNQLGYFPESEKENFIVFLSQEVITAKTELKVTFSVAKNPSNPMSGLEFENEVVERLSKQTTKDKLKTFLNDRGVAIIDSLIHIVVIKTTPSHSLLRIETPLSGTALMTGHMFNVITKSSPVRIAGLDVLASTDREQISIKVWTKPGSYATSILIESDWTLIQEQTVQGVDGQLVSLNDFECPIDIDQNSEHAFYVSSTHRMIVGDQDDGTGSYIGITENEDLQIDHGIGLARYFSRERRTYRWMGGMRYSLSTDAIDCSWQDTQIQ